MSTTLRPTPVLRCLLTAIIFFAGIKAHGQDTLKVQQPKYNGTWVNDTATVPDDNTSGVLTINRDTINWNIINYQMLVDFTPKMKGDTLLLLYKGCECSHAFRISTIKFPKPQSVYAKCYPVTDSLIGVTYMNKAFSESLNSYVRGKISKTEIRLMFPEVMFRRTPKPTDK